MSPRRRVLDTSHPLMRVWSMRASLCPILPRERAADAMAVARAAEVAKEVAAAAEEAAQESPKVARDALPDRRETALLDKREIAPRDVREDLARRVTEDPAKRETEDLAKRVTEDPVNLVSPANPAMMVKTEVREDSEALAVVLAAAEVPPATHPEMVLKFSPEKTAESR